MDQPVNDGTGNHFIIENSVPFTKLNNNRVLGTIKFSIGLMKIEVIDYPEIMVFSMKKEMKDFSQEIPQLIQSSLDELTKKGRTPAGPPILLYYMENVEPNQLIEKMMVEVAWPVNSEQFSNGALLKIKATRVM